jgi:uncharacterized protein with PIN domain
MNRIRKGYELRFRSLLQAAGARRLEPGVQSLVRKAQRLGSREGVPLADALARVYDELAARPPFQASKPAPATLRFFCDAGLGGLARWLRAAGYEALWEAGIDDSVLVGEAARASAAILTTDSLLMERRVLRDGVVRAFWLPPTLRVPEQLALVFREFALTARASRCMSCGGDLRRVDKEALRERIPPRTYRWLDVFFVCVRCDKLFWHGTHWATIQRQLEALGGTRSDGGQSVQPPAR